MTAERLMLPVLEIFPSVFSAPTVLWDHKPTELYSFTQLCYSCLLDPAAIIMLKGVYLPNGCVLPLEEMNALIQTEGHQLSYFSENAPV